MKPLKLKPVIDKRAGHKPNAAKSSKLKGIKKQPGKSFIKLGDKKPVDKKPPFSANGTTAHPASGVKPTLRKATNTKKTVTSSAKTKKPVTAKDMPPQSGDNKPPKQRKPRKTAPPPRVYAAWVVYDKTGKRIEVFPYRDRWAAEKCAKKKGDGHYFNLVKEMEGK